MIHWLAAVALAGPSLPNERYELENGLDVVLIRDPATPLVAVDLWYHVGSRDEAAGRTGFAHLFEHLMFQGSPAQPDEYMAPLEKIGANINGSTNPDRTNYYEVVPREYLPLALFLEADRMGGLLETLSQEKLDNQREVVRNERRQRYENVPYGDARMLLYQNLFPAGHGYHHPTIGSHADLEAAKLEDVSGFFRRWYAPNNAVLVISGDFDPKVAKDIVQKYFGPIPRAAEEPRPAVPEVSLPASVEVRDYRAVPQRKVWLAWHSPAWGTQPDAELDLLASFLGDGRDGRLVRELVEKRKVARDVTVFQASSGWSSVFQIQATAADGHTTDEVVAAVDEVLTQVLGTATSGGPDGATTPAHLAPTADDLAAIARQYELGYLDRLEPVLGKAELAQGCLRTFGQPDCVQTDLERYRKATPESVLATGRQWLQKPRVALHILPEADRPAVAAAPVEEPTGKKGKRPKKPKKTRKNQPADEAPTGAGVTP